MHRDAREPALIEAATGQEMSAIEWCGLLLLLVILLGLIAVLPGGTVLGAVVAGTLAGAVVTLMILLRRLDLLRWHERVTIWEPTTHCSAAWGPSPTCRCTSSRAVGTGRPDVCRLSNTSIRIRSGVPSGVRVVDLGDRGHNGNGSLPSRMRSKL
ncbi:MAG: hypothetical protein JOZ68_12085 [Acidimicrobiia bacterium]|nr:hypothetical protein [Acidimicrobiia bacterium]